MSSGGSRPRFDMLALICSLSSATVVVAGMTCTWCVPPPKAE